MISSIITFGAFLLCAIPFYIIALCEKNSTEPITFWTGDETLKSKVKNIPAYNLAMSRIYLVYAITLTLGAVLSFITLIGSVIIICLDLTVGLYLLYRKYKKILSTYSK